MPNDNQVPEESGRADSVFPPDEAASFCSRPTPVVPPPDDLRKFESLKPPRVSYPELRPSSRPTYVPDEVDYPSFDDEEGATRPGGGPSPESGAAPLAVHGAPDSGPSVSVGPLVALDSVVPAPVAESAPDSAPDVGPESAPESAPGSGAARMPWRRWFARGLFVVLFSGVAGLLGYALHPEVGRTVRGFGVVAGASE